MQWFHHYAKYRNTEPMKTILNDKNFGIKGYASDSLIKEILTENFVTYMKNRKDFTSMVISQWCSELHTKPKVLRRFLECYGKELGYEWELQSANKTLLGHSDNDPKTLWKDCRNVLIIKNPELFKNLEKRTSRINKNNKEYTRISKNNKEKNKQYAKQDFADNLKPKQEKIKSEIEPTQNENKSVGFELNQLITLFKDINPTYERIFANKSQRNALERLKNKLGIEKLTETIKSLKEIVDQKYAPVITTPIQLEQKLGDLFIFLKRSNPEKEIAEDKYAHLKWEGGQ